MQTTWSRWAAGRAASTGLAPTHVPAGCLAPTGTYLVSANACATLSAMRACWTLL